MKVLDLFSGIGGFSLGLERAGMTTVAFCEKEAFQRSVLKHHWPDVPCYDDICTLTQNRLVEDGIKEIDLICGGFPCQDISLAGKGEGVNGKRSGLWSEYKRIINEVGPRWVIIENVPALRSRGLVTVLQNLSEVGYDAEWHCITASHFGAPHRRDRIFIIAYPNGTYVERGCLSGRIHKKHPNPDGCSDTVRWENSQFRVSKPGMDRVVNGVPNQMDRLKSLGNSIVPKVAESIGEFLMKEYK